MDRPKSYHSFCRFDVRFAALTAGFITVSTSFLSLVIYICKGLTAEQLRRDQTETDYVQAYLNGVELCQLLLIAAHFLIILLSTVLLIGICRENVNLILSWLVGFVALLCLELIGLISSTVLSTHVHKAMDALLQAEVAFCLTRLLVNGLAIASVVAFYQQLTGGRSWKPLTNNYI